jgi:hypothetical protein
LVKKQTGKRMRPNRASKEPPSKDDGRKKTSVYLQTDHVQWLLDYQANHFDRTKERVTKNQLIDLAMDLLIAKCEDDTNFVSVRTG